MYMKNWKEKRQYTFLIVVIVLALMLGVITYAWLFYRNSMITMAPVIHPGSIAITGPDGSVMDAFDLSYSDDEITTEADGTKRVTINREFCVKSTAKHYKLEIVHTTNMKGLVFSLARKDNPSQPLEGKFLNLGQRTPEGTDPLQYNYANDTKHSSNFDEYENVQAHAEPLYWKVNDVLNSNTDPEHTVKEIFSGEEVTYYLTDYVLSITWIEENKETDLFYILAENVE